MESVTLDDSEGILEDVYCGVGWLVCTLCVMKEVVPDSERNERESNLPLTLPLTLCLKAAGVKFCFTYCDETYKAYSTFKNLYFVICMSNENET